MSNQVNMVVPRPSFNGGIIRRVRTLITIASAKLLATRRPATIEKILRRVAAHCRPATAESSLSLRRDVEALSVTCAGEGCLPRSIAICLLSAQAGLRWPTWKTGVTLEPFRAHAWVECGDKPIGEPKDFRAGDYLVTIEIGAGRD